MRLGTGEAAAGAGYQVGELGGECSALIHGNRATQLYHQIHRRQLQTQMAETVPQDALDSIAQHRSAGITLR